jgi:hypothetical protein
VAEQVDGDAVVRRGKSPSSVPPCALLATRNQPSNTPQPTSLCEPPRRRAVDRVRAATPPTSCASTKASAPPLSSGHGLGAPTGGNSFGAVRHGARGGVAEHGLFRDEFADDGDDAVAASLLQDEERASGGGSVAGSTRPWRSTLTGSPSSPSSCSPPRAAI